MDYLTWKINFKARKWNSSGKNSKAKKVFDKPKKGFSHSDCVPATAEVGFTISKDKLKILKVE